MRDRSSRIDIYIYILALFDLDKTYYLLFLHYKEKIFYIIGFYKNGVYLYI